MKPQYTLFAIAVLFLIGCNKNDDQFSPILPAITAEGKNTFGVYIDGTLVTPRNGEGSFNLSDNGMILYSDPGTSQFNYYDLRVRDYQSDNGALFILHIEPVQQLGIGPFSIEESNCEDNLGGIPNPNINITCRLYNPTTQTTAWYCSLADTGELIISRYDLENRILSGTFSCSAVNKDNPNEVIDITQGRFDLKWDELPYVTFP